MAVTLLTNTSPSAPTLNGAAGSLIGVLDYCLTNGTYGVGWTKEYTGTNLAAYRAPAGNRMYLGVDDSATLNSRVRGFEAMTAAGVAVASGTAPFPTDAQQSGGLYVYKGSDTGTTRSWMFISDGKVFYLSLQPTGSLTAQNLFCFGEFESYKAGDSYNTLIVGETAASSHTSGGGVTPGYGSSSSGHFLPRAHGQLGGALTCGKAVADVLRFSPSSTNIGSNGVSYPSLLDGGLLMSPILVTEPSAGVRGRLPGLWSPLHNRPLTDGDTFSGSGTLAGRTFLVRNVGSSGQAV